MASTAAPTPTPESQEKGSVLGGIRPDLTPAQLTSALPILVALLAAFGLWDPTDEQNDALTAAVGWAAALVLGDAGLRAGRNIADSRKVTIAPPEMSVGSSYERPPGTPGTMHVQD